jgi:hypothetical protein
VTKKTTKKSPRAPKPEPAKVQIGPGAFMEDPYSPEFREEYPWTAGEMCDSYTSVEAMLFAWFEREGFDMSRGAVVDLAVRMSACISPFRSFYRATEGWEGYDLETCRQKAKLAEEKL